MTLANRFAASEQDKAGTPQSADRFQADARRRLRCVIVEDELMAAWMIEGLLEELGHDVLAIFCDGETALWSPALAEAELVILDINLGSGITGIEAAAEMRRVTPVPIVFCSAYSDEVTRMRALEAAPGASFAAKPVSQNELSVAIAAATAVRH
jgi:DNA-binding response OmpR family regulator